ncbi:MULTISPECIES: tetratricopeptide repeat protein [Glaesserella]|uniref:Sel1 repeat family protein n=1 Tax=Glaesserella australis TaxID=2094024 RepID=A0A328BYV0_9PAST|nr:MULTISPECIES: SEL1-like repeat protein [Glaesserella]AUI66908.1 hypothetical protein CJD39_10150 [Glaesserella sp. 15-184]RAL19528.1 hypothetical protein C5N92_02415 [Glaesserella australis]
MKLKKALLLSIFSLAVVGNVYAETDSQKIDKINQYLAEGNGKKALPLLKALATKGRVDAQSVLASLYWSGSKGIKKDNKQAFKWASKAEKQGDTKARYILGTMYMNGEYVKEDLMKAGNLLLKACKEEPKLGNCYLILSKSDVEKMCSEGHPKCQEASELFR